MIKELETVVLTHSCPEHGLQRGDVGAVVHVYGSGEAYEVEFVTAAGKTLAVITAEPGDIRPMAKSEILHVRALESEAA